MTRTRKILKNKEDKDGEEDQRWRWGKKIKLRWKNGKGTPQERLLLAIKLFGC